MRSLGSISENKEYKLVCRYCGEILALKKSDMTPENDRLLLPCDSSCICINCNEKIFFKRDELKIVLSDVVGYI